MSWSLVNIWKIIKFSLKRWLRSASQITFSVRDIYKPVSLRTRWRYVSCSITINILVITCEHYILPARDIRELMVGKRTEIIVVGRCRAYKNTKLQENVTILGKIIILRKWHDQAKASCRCECWNCEVSVQREKKGFFPCFVPLSEQVEIHILRNNTKGLEI